MNIIQVHHGDCFEVMQTMEDESIDLIATDPPYNTGNTFGATLVAARRLGRNSIGIDTNEEAVSLSRSR